MAASDYANLQETACVLRGVHRWIADCDTGQLIQKADTMVPFDVSVSINVQNGLARNFPAHESFGNISDVMPRRFHLDSRS